MGFLQPNLPVVDHDSWRRLPRQERVAPLARHFAEHGFGSPDVVILLYVFKVGLYVAGGWAFIMSTPGVDGWLDVTSWWKNPAVFYKAAIWTSMFEVLGLGCGFGPLNLRFMPPLGSVLYWLRPGTIRLPPWPGRLPLTGGDTRTPVDVVLYAGMLVSMVLALSGAMTRGEVAAVLVFLVLIGLRDQTIFLAARGEVYGSLMVTSLFVAGDQVTAAKLVMVTIWGGAAISKLNVHFPYVVSAMLSNSPMWRFGGLRTRFLHRNFPDDLRPARLPATLAHSGTVVELIVPTVMLVSSGGWPLRLAAGLLIFLHLVILTSLPMGVPLEWNVFMIWGILSLFVAHPGVDLGALAHPWLPILVVAVLVFFVAYGNLVPRNVSFLPSMRYYAGNWATTVWAFRGDALDRLDAGVVKATMLPHQQLEKVYGSAEEAEIPLHMGYAFRGFHTHGRAQWSLLPRLCGPEHEDYLVLDGELVAGTVLGWNFGDGHLHDEQLIAALQRRCDFRPGDVRVLILESQPIHRQQQEYRLIDAATGEFERGLVHIADMTARQPTDADVPAHPYPT